MRRKYDIRNKKNFIIILVLSIIIVTIFSLFIYKYSKASKIEYIIESGSVLQDVDKNYLSIDDDAILKIRWNGSYYLVYNDENINLGKKVIIYNTITGGMNLYGTFYEIGSDGKIIENKEETVLANTTNAKFYKLDDREYLVVDRTISSDDKSIEASNYILVELDKAGNAKLSNNKINLKTITPTKLITSKYTFDIANEILNFGKYDIDLKKIIGTTNQYKPEDDENGTDSGTGDGIGSGTGSGSDGGSGTDTGTGNGSGDGAGSGTGSGNNIGTGSGTGSGTGTGSGNGIGSGESTGPGDIINNGDVGNIPDMDDILDKIKMTSIIRVVEGLTQIDVDYVIYDPYNEYKSVYVEVIKPGEVEIVHLSKTDTHVTIDSLNANTDYRLNFIYTTVKKDVETEVEELIPYTFEQFDLRTKMPEYSISIYKLSKVTNILTYKVNLQSGYSISSLNVNLSFDYNELDVESGNMIQKKASLDGTVSVNSGSSYVLGNFDISGYEFDADTVLKLTVKNVTKGDIVLPVNATYSFRFGR
ncbi:MAG: hypothetical protein IJE89_03450 [Bacilli bacterium]|nr:hypothetical protein [Bacilli bacterium]